MPIVLRAALLVALVLALLVAGSMLSRSWAVRGSRAAPIAPRAVVAAALLAGIGATLALVVLPVRVAALVVVVALLLGLLATGLPRGSRGSGG